MRLEGLTPTETLRQAGIVNPLRLPKLIRDAINFLDLDLSGLTVLTEAASGPYVVTPVIAAVAGADRVIALTQESQYAGIDNIILQTRALEELCHLQGSVEIHTERRGDLFGQADIVTNLGFVRPLDAHTVAAMKPTAVVPLMCEAWEFRPGDVDLDACRARGIAVLATNEDFPGLQVFDYSGWLCMKMLFEAQIEMHKSIVLIVSSDKFGETIKNRLDSCLISAALVRDLRTPDAREALSKADVLVIADYTRNDTILGPGGDIEADELHALSPAITVLQFAGPVDIASLRENGVPFYPAFEAGYRRMAKTLAFLGPRPVVELHAAGLKVGQAAATARLFKGLSTEASAEFALTESPAQLITSFKEPG